MVVVSGEVQRRAKQRPNNARSGSHDLAIGAFSSGCSVASCARGGPFPEATLHMVRGGPGCPIARSELCFYETDRARQNLAVCSPALPSRGRAAGPTTRALQACRGVAEGSPEETTPHNISPGPRLAARINNARLPTQSLLLNRESVLPTLYSSFSSERFRHVQDILA